MSSSSFNESEKTHTNLIRALEYHMERLEGSDEAKESIAKILGQLRANCRDTVHVALDTEFERDCLRNENAECERMITELEKDLRWHEEDASEIDDADYDDDLDELHEEDADGEERWENDDIVDLNWIDDEDDYDSWN